MVAKTTVNGIQELKALAGKHLGHSDWLEMTQDRVNLFAEATSDHQWIHVDPERAKSESPFGGPIAHGYLTLSLLPFLLDQIIEVRGVAMAINYGLNRLRYPAPVPVGRRVRLDVALGQVEEVRGGIQSLLECTVEVEGSDKPALAAEVLFRYYA